MTQSRTIAGLQWRPYGPSHYELLGHPEVSVSYLGDTTGLGGWYLHALDRNGDSHMLPCPSRDAACSIVATAFRIDSPSIFL